MAAVKQSRAPVSSIAVIVSHPLRAKCWTVLTERVASPKELTELVGDSLANVSYAVRVLEKAGAIDLVKTEPRRGAVEHWYAASERPNASDEDTETRTPEERTEFARYIGQRSFADYSVALEAGTFGARHDHYTWRMPMLVDETGWRELNKIYAEMTERIMDEQAASAERMSRAQDAESIPVTALAMFFEVPGRKAQER
jgi:hypothetical protein